MVTLSHTAAVFNNQVKKKIIWMVNHKINNNGFLSFYTQAISSRIGLEEKRIKERLGDLVLMANESSNEDQESKKINYLDDHMYCDN